MGCEGACGGRVAEWQSGSGEGSVIGRLLVVACHHSDARTITPRRHLVHRTHGQREVLPQGVALEAVVGKDTAAVDISKGTLIRRICRHVVWRMVQAERNRPTRRAGTASAPALSRARARHFTHRSGWFEKKTPYMSQTSRSNQLAPEKTSTAEGTGVISSA